MNILSPLSSIFYSNIEVDYNNSSILRMPLLLQAQISEFLKSITKLFDEVDARRIDTKNAFLNF